MLQTISITEFAKRFRHRVIDHKYPVTWFLGAGCSITSGIPAAGALTRRWLQELHEMQGTAKPLLEWAAGEFNGYDQNAAARHYATIFKRRHPTTSERQREIEQVCTLGEPGYGYATFAQILSHEPAGSMCNTVLTTNFDDLIADALYLYGDRRKRPQIITHDALARYIRLRSPRPMVVKLHGDAMFDPRNLQDETDKIDEAVASHLYPILQDSALVFIGYGGNDQSVCKFLKAFSQQGLSHPVFWVGATDPCDDMLDWLTTHSAQRVAHSDFDSLMHILRGELGLGLVSEDRWMSGYRRYIEHFEQFEKDLADGPRDETREALQRASDTATSSLEGAWSYVMQAIRLHNTDTDAADRLYREGIEKFPHHGPLIGNYALFLRKFREDMDGAEQFYKRAIEIAPDDVDHLGNYALFLHNVRKDMEGAEQFYKRAIEADPDHANNLGNYALFLQDVRKDMKGAEQFYKRAIEVDSDHANNLGNYALFLLDVRKDMEGAEQLYKRAIEADPDHANNLGNYAQAVLTKGERADGQALLERSLLKAEPGRQDGLLAELQMYRLAHFPNHAAEALKALSGLIENDARSNGWNFSITIDAAERDGCQHIPLLKDLARVLSENADPIILDQHPDWTAIAG